MKKTYINPALKVVLLNSGNVICNSPVIQPTDSNAQSQSDSDYKDYTNGGDALVRQQNLWDDQW